MGVAISAGIVGELAGAVKDLQVPEETVLGIFRFGSTDSIKKFVSGHLRMRPLTDYATLNNDPVRSDRCEGDVYWSRPGDDGLQVMINGEFKPIGIVGALRQRLSGPAPNVFCMYALRG